MYTDGIPEAEGAERSHYGLKRLISVVQKHWSQSAHAIQERVIEDVRSHIGNHRVYDDITLVILKKRYQAHKKAKDDELTSLAE